MPSISGLTGDGRYQHFFRQAVQGTAGLVAEWMAPDSRTGS
jgi:uncharacterized protein YdiU (UPF0061 family)